MALNRKTWHIHRFCIVHFENEARCENWNVKRQCNASETSVIDVFSVWFSYEYGFFVNCSVCQALPSNNIKLISQYQPPFLLGVGAIFSPKFWKRSGGGVRKNEYLEGLKYICHRYLPGSLLCPCQKKLFKINCGFEGSISNVDLGLFRLKNQLKFSFVTFLFR